MFHLTDRFYENEIQTHKKNMRNKEELSQYWIDRNQMCMFTPDLPSAQSDVHALFG